MKHDILGGVLPGGVDAFVRATRHHAKAGVQDGAPLSGRGMKGIQLVRTAVGWRISAAAWDDERPGLPFPADPA